MSWQAYADQLSTSLNGSPAGVIGHDGALWASAAKFSLLAGEGAKVAAFFKNPGDALAQGIAVGGVKYITIKADNRSLYGKKGATGVCLVKTGQTILAAQYGDQVQPGTAANVTEKLADYLIENGC